MTTEFQIIANAGHGDVQEPMLLPRFIRPAGAGCGFTEGKCDRDKCEQSADGFQVAVKQHRGNSRPGGRKPLNPECRILNPESFSHQSLCFGPRTTEAF